MQIINYATAHFKLEFFKTLNWESIPYEVKFLDSVPGNDQDLQVNYDVDVNVVTNPNDWIGLYDVSKLLSVPFSFRTTVYSK